MTKWEPKTSESVTQFANRVKRQLNGYGSIRVQYGNVTMSISHNSNPCDIAVIYQLRSKLKMLGE